LSRWDKIKFYVGAVFVTVILVLSAGHIFAKTYMDLRTSPGLDVVVAIWSLVAVVLISLWFLRSGVAPAP